MGLMLYRIQRTKTEPSIDHRLISLRESNNDESAFQPRTNCDSILTVSRKPANLRHPIKSEVNGNPVELVTVGYVALALGRTTWTVDRWERFGLIPPAPFLL